MKNICFQMSRKAWLALIAVLCMSMPALAQKITVTGTVLDPEGEPLIGASVVAQGAEGVGVSTNIDGQYTLNVDAKATLVFSYVGYNTQTVPVDGRTTINVTMTENSVMLGEVVAIGYGSIKKSDATGAVAMVKPDEVSAGLATSAQDLLVGKSPGVVVTTNGGDPQGGADIVIRGGASLSASNAPLIVIDGVPMDTHAIDGSSNPLSMVNPENIESMTILKDASATTIFGSRASNGVIIITTKKGKAGKPEVTFTANMYIATPRKWMPMMHADEYRDFITNQYGVGSSQYNALGDARTDWQKGVLQTSVSSDYNLSVGGKWKALPYRVSASWTGNNGIIKKSSMERTTFGLNLSPKFFDDLLTVNANVRGAYIKNEFKNDDALGSAMGFNPTLPVYAADGNPFMGYTTYVGTDVAGPDADGSKINTLKAINPVSLVKEWNNRSEVWQSIGNLQLDLAIPYFRDLHANLNLGYEVSKSDGSNYWNNNSPMAWKLGSNRMMPNDKGEMELKTGVKDGVSTYNRYHQLKVNTLLDFYLNYRKDVDAIHSGFDVTAGYSWQKFRTQGWSYGRNNDAEGFQAFPTSRSRSDLALVSFFGRLNYTFMDRYLLTATVRRDGTSRFSKDHRWGTFPSVALGWKILDESFMEGARGWMNTLKIRAGYGITGQQDLGDDLFPYLPAYTIGNNGDPTPNTTAYPNIIPDGKGGFINVIRPNGYNPTIKWEETHTWNAGIDFGFLNNRIMGSIEFYKRKTKDLLTWTTVAAGSNLTNAMNMNIGDLENIGLEFNITTRPVVTKDFTWTSEVSVGWNKNKITKLTQGDDPDFFIMAGQGISAGTGGQVQAHTVGKPAYSFYVYQQVYDQDGNPIPGQFVDRNGDGQINESDKYYYHSRDPKVTLTWNNTFNYKNWDFGFSLRSNIGNYVYNDFEAGNVDISTATSSVPLSNLMSDRFLFTNMGDKGYLSDYFVRNASFLRCDNITLGYTFPNLLNNALRLRLYGAVQNAFVITKYNGLDPEVFSGVDSNVYPRPLTVSFGVVAQF